MINLLIFSIIVGIVFSLVIVPFILSTQAKRSADEARANVSVPFNRGAAIATVATLSTAVVFAFYYATNMDRNWTSFWLALLLVTFLGVVVAGGKDRKLKIVLFLGALAFGRISSVHRYSMRKKYKAVEMDQQVEIKAFDETKTPASVPPKFARNKMKKAFGQVPNTSYYELGNLQIQKVNDEFVYIAPVEFSGLFKWWNGKTTPGILR